VLGSGFVVNVADIPVHENVNTTSKLSDAVAARLASLATAASNPALALSSLRCNRHIGYRAKLGWFDGRAIPATRIKSSDPVAVASKASMEATLAAAAATLAATAKQASKPRRSRKS
jgi:hypothetical protein